MSRPEQEGDSLAAVWANKFGPLAAIELVETAASLAAMKQ